MWIRSIKSKDSAETDTIYQCLGPVSEPLRSEEACVMHQAQKTGIWGGYDFMHFSSECRRAVSAKLMRCTCWIEELFCCLYHAECRVQDSKRVTSPHTPIRHLHNIIPGTLTLYLFWIYLAFSKIGYQDIKTNHEYDAIRSIHKFSKIYTLMV